MTKARLCDVQLAISSLRLARPRKPDPLDNSKSLREMKADADLADRLRYALKAKRDLGTGPMKGRKIEALHAQAMETWDEVARELRNELNEALASRVVFRPRG